MATTGEQQAKERGWLPKGVHRLIIVLTIVFALALGIPLMWMAHDDGRPDWEWKLLTDAIDANPDSEAWERYYAKEREWLGNIELGRDSRYPDAWNYAPAGARTKVTLVHIGISVIWFLMFYSGFLFAFRAGHRTVLWIADRFRNPE